MQLAHISAVCTTADNAQRFYAGLLKLTIIKDFSLEADLCAQIFGKRVACQVMLFGSENFSIEVFIYKDGLQPANPFVHHCLEVPDKAAFLAQCKEEALEVRLIPKGDKTLSFIRDFDGNLYEIK